MADEKRGSFFSIVTFYLTLSSVPFFSFFFISRRYVEMFEMTRVCVISLSTLSRAKVLERVKISKEIMTSLGKYKYLVYDIC